MTQNRTYKLDLSSKPDLKRRKNYEYPTTGYGKHLTFKIQLRWTIFRLQGPLPQSPIYENIEKTCPYNQIRHRESQNHVRTRQNTYRRWRGRFVIVKHRRTLHVNIEQFYEEINNGITITKIQLSWVT